MSSDPNPFVTRWIDENAHPITLDPGAPSDDLAALRDIVGDAVVAGVGAVDRATREPRVARPPGDASGVSATRRRR